METFISRMRAVSIPSFRICSACRNDMISSRKSRASRILSDGTRAQLRFKGNIASPGKQAQPLEGFYADLLKNPVHSIQHQTKTQPSPAPADGLPMTEKDERLQKARLVFGSRLAGPQERADQLRRESTSVAGIMVPARPSEPDDCCMSGCVNCVWDRYRDELEEWAAASAEARSKMQSQSEDAEATATTSVASDSRSHVAVSMDDDGGGGDTNWTASGDASADIFSDIPVGIREFMRTEKKLKQRHQREGTTGG